MVKCTVIETSGLRQGICDLCDHHCERDLEGMGGVSFRARTSLAVVLLPAGLLHQAA